MDNIFLPKSYVRLWKRIQISVNNDPRFWPGLKWLHHKVSAKLLGQSYGFHRRTKRYFTEYSNISIEKN